jgi:hypothetical protein
MTIAQRAEQFRYALQLFSRTLDEEKALRVATIFDPWDAEGHSYEIGEYCAYGTNGVGDPQLYVCLQAHASQSGRTPDTAVSLFKAVGITNEGYPEWSQPVGTSDAYMTGDIVSYHGSLYISVIDNNVWSPETYPAGWSAYTE